MNSSTSDDTDPELEYVPKYPRFFLKIKDLPSGTRIIKWFAIRFYKTVMKYNDTPLRDASGDANDGKTANLSLV